MHHHLHWINLKAHYSWTVDFLSVRAASSRLNSLLSPAVLALHLCDKRAKWEENWHFHKRRNSAEPMPSCRLTQTLLLSHSLGPVFCCRPSGVVISFVLFAFSSVAARSRSMCVWNVFFSTPPPPPGVWLTPVKINNSSFSMLGSHRCQKEEVSKTFHI